MSALGRRALLAGASIALAASDAALALAEPTRPAAASNNPDALLIATAAEAVRLELEYRRLCWATDCQDERAGTPEQAEALVEFAAVQAEIDAPFDLLADMHPTTPEGWRAKARAILEFYRGAEPDDDGAAGPALWSLVTDLAGEGTEA